MKRGLFILLVLLVLPFVSANQNSMKLLSVANVNGTLVGSTADLYIDIEQGHGRVFLDTFPLSNLDTQISTRFAKEIACDIINKDCSNIDFFYTIRSNSVLIGGPSAGAAIAVLTVARLENLDMDDKVIITGTINSGGLIGPVSGMKEKVDAAIDNGFEKVLIPSRARYVVQGNESLDLIKYGEGKGISVLEVSTLNQAVYEFTGKIYEEANEEIKIPENYQKTMISISNAICDRAINFEKKDSFSDTNSSVTLSEATELMKKARDALSEEKYYSAASFCFGANIKYNHLYLQEQNLSTLEVDEFLDNLEQDIDTFFEELNSKEIQTITDLETHMIVRERLVGAQDYVNSARLILEKNSTSSFDLLLYQTSYAEERFLSAELWSEFFNVKSRHIDIGQTELRDSCIKKISETQERLEYVKSFFSTMSINLDSISDSLQLAFDDMKNEEYALCLFKASKSKAEIDVLVNALGFSMDNIDVHIENKLSMIKNIIANQQKKGMFPLLGYSYYEYASLLKDEDFSSALLYSEYALELSRLDIYFGENGKRHIFFNKGVFISFIFGSLFGFIASLIIVNNYINKKIKKSRKH